MCLFPSLLHLLFLYRHLLQPNRNIHFSHFELVATTCIFLACKTEETFKKCDEVIHAAHRIRPFENMSRELRSDSVEFTELKEKLFKIERVLLQALNFDLIIVQPNQFIISTVKKVAGQEDLKSTKSIIQGAWNFANDSFLTKLCLMYQPEKVAAVSILLAQRILEIPEDTRYLKELDTTEDEFESMAREFQDLMCDNEEISKKLNKETKKQRFTPFGKRE
jgi:transcription initiation factor TFIIIB Brf1 subunit/transcription initiation factor TFIIB